MSMPDPVVPRTKRRLTIVPPLPSAEKYVPPSEMYRDEYDEEMRDMRDVCRRCSGILKPGSEVVTLTTDKRIYYAHIECPEDNDE